MSNSITYPDIPFTVNGIIAEYNPFHNGHSYHIQQAKEDTGADYTVIAMSGNFMQRGTPALLDKYKRAEMALRNGADLVLELPSVYAASSADYFATGAVTLLDRLGVVDFLNFGSECGDVELLQQIADILVEEPEEYASFLKEQLHQGLSYPLARSKALIHYQPELGDYINVLSSPNNILGIAYLKALRRRQSKMKPTTVSRVFSEYHDRLTGEYHSSSLALRQAIYDSQDIHLLASQMPESSFRILENALSDNGPMRLNDLSAALHYKLLMEADKGYTDYLDVSQELSDRICNHLYEYTSFREFCDLLKTKDMTYTRVSRCLMHILLDMKIEFPEQYRQGDYIRYARVLGFRREAEPLFAAIKKSACIPLLTKIADAEQVLDSQGYDLFQKELRINAVYESAAAIKSGRPMTNEYRSPIVII
jgi:predicted nucleotidyltransferase